MEKNLYQPDFYNEFITYPTRLITDQLKENLCASRYFAAPLVHSKKAIRYRLSGKITKLYGDFQTPESPKAVIEIRLILEKMESNAFTTFFNKTYKSDEPIALGDPKLLAQGWTTGLGKIILEFLSDFRAAKRSSALRLNIKTHHPADPS